MKYILICVAALLVCFICAWVPAIFVSRKKKLGKGITFLMGTGISILLILVTIMGYIGIYYHASDEAYTTSDIVEFSEIDEGFFFDGPGSDTALIFYPGAKVEAMAYAPLMNLLAEQGIDCFLADMPGRMAFFGSNIAEKIQSRYGYDTWVAAGHSMGGLVISSYAADHGDSIDYLVLLASYPGRPVPDSIRMLSIYGSNDGCLNIEAYKDGKKNWPNTGYEYVISGGNHANYANYGQQKGDLESEISREKQQEITAGKILELIGK